jgi:hypothetical protein
MVYIRGAFADLPTASLSFMALQQTQTTPLTYRAALRALVADFEQVVGTCRFSLEGMRYNDLNGQPLPVNSAGVFFPAAAWLRAFFHDAGTFIKQPSKGGPKGELTAN